MADSETSTSLSAVTRRDLLAGTTALPLTLITPDAAAISPPARDPVVDLWRNWRTAYAAFDRWCARSSRLEADLIDRIGYPRIAVPVPHGPKPIHVACDDDIDAVLGMAPQNLPLRTRLRTGLRHRQARWQAAAVACGLTAAERHADAAHDLTMAIEAAIFRAPAASLAGVAAKLAVVIRRGEPAPHETEFPWPQLRSALADLHRLANIAHPLDELEKVTNRTFDADNPLDAT